MLDRNLPFTDNNEGEYILSDYHMKLHYSQTMFMSCERFF